MSDEDLGRALGCTQATVSSWEINRTAPPVDRLVALYHLGLNINWLLVGEGPMLLSELAASGVRVPASVDIEELAERVARLERQNAIAQAVLNPPSGDRSGG